MSKLTDKAFAEYVAKTKERLGRKFSLAGEKPINYGWQLTAEQDGRRALLNIYNGRKGLTLVYNGDSALAAAMRALLEGGEAETGAVAPEEAQGLRAGSDESGKGDFFGSLVVAAVAVDDAAAAKLRAAGVKDCKLLTDKKILELEAKIKEAVVDFSVLELKPRVYNLRYAQVAAAGGKLNQLLGSGHIAALSQVLERQPECRRALIDQFTASTEILRRLQQRFPACAVRQQPRAEADLAVAAASLLARARFLRTLEELARTAGEAALPRGGGSAATACARKLADRLGREALRDYVKLHFVNYQRL